MRPAAMAMVNTLVLVTLWASETWTVKVDVPLAVGVPEIVPVAPSKMIPAGGAPFVIDHVYGNVPPVAASVTVVYTTPTVPLGRVGAVVMVGPGVMVNEKACVAEPPPLSVTFAVKLKGPEAVGVPVRAPAVLRFIPAGNAPPETVHL